MARTGRCCVLAALLIIPAYSLYLALAAPPAEAPAGEATGLGRRWLLLLANTAAVTGTAALLATALGAAGALLAVRTDLPGRSVLRLGAAAAATLPPYITAVAVFSVFPVWSWTGSRLACGILYGLTYAPLAGLIVGLGLQRGSRDLEDLALLDARPLRVIAHVTLRLARGSLLAAAALVAWLTATDFTYTDLLVVRTFAEEVYTQFALGHRAGPLQSALPLIVFAWAGAVAGVLVLRRRVQDAQAAPTPAPRIFPLGRWRWPIAVAVFAIVGLAAGLPAGHLVQHLSPGRSLLATASGFLPELGATAGLSALAALVMLLPAGTLAWSIARHRRDADAPRLSLRNQGMAAAMILALALALPAPVVGTTLIELLNRPGWLGQIYDSPAIIVLGYVARFQPIVVALLVPAAARVPQSLVDAARLDGCGPARLAWHIRRPALRRDTRIAFLILIILCFGELGTTALLAPPGWPTVSVRAFSLLHFGVYRDLAVLAVLSGAAILVPWLILVCIYRKWRCQREP